jgi:predicted RNase H-like HicB family nuclease
MWSDEDESYVATIPEFPGLSAFGDTPEEAAGEAKIAAEGFMEVFKEDGRLLPDPALLTPLSGQFRIRIPKSLHASLSHEAKEEGVSLNTHINHLLSERNAFLKVKKEIEKTNRVVHLNNPLAFAGTSGQAFIVPGQIDADANPSVKWISVDSGSVVVKH